MRTAIDTNVFSAIWSWESSAERVTILLEQARLQGALLISPFVFAELLAYPGSSEAYVRGFLDATGAALDVRIEERVWTVSGQRYAHYAARRRQATGEGPRRILADFLIGAHALVQADRLLTLEIGRASWR